MLHICLAFRDADGLYALHAAASLVSVLQHTAMPLGLHCIHDESLRPQGRHCLERVAAHFGKHICFHDIRNMLAKMPDIHIPVLGLGSLYRYFIPECIMAEHVLYLDCDICCTCDVAEIYDEAQKHPKAPLACVLDDGAQHVPAMKTYVKGMGLKTKTYFNSGVLVWNTPVVRELFPHFVQTAIKMTERLAHAQYKDQDVLNALFANTPVHFLDGRYNFIMHILDRLLLPPHALQGKILHYCACKPWGEKNFPAIQLHQENYRVVERIVGGQ